MPYKGLRNFKVFLIHSWQRNSKQLVGLPSSWAWTRWRSDRWDGIESVSTNRSVSWWFLFRRKPFWPLLTCYDNKRTQGGLVFGGSSKIQLHCPPSGVSQLPQQHPRQWCRCNAVVHHQHWKGEKLWNIHKLWEMPCAGNLQWLHVRNVLFLF